MRQFFRFGLINYFLPVLIIIAIVVPVSLRQYPLKSEVLQHAYQQDIADYGWANKIGPVKGFILGASTLRYGLSASALSTGDSAWVNFAMDARDPIVSYFLLGKYFPLKKPQIVLVGLDPWIFSKKYYIHRDKIMYLDLTAPQMVAVYNLDKSVFFTKFNKLVMSGFVSLNDTENDTAGTMTIPPDNGSVKLTEKSKNFNNVKEDWFEIQKFGWSDIEFDYVRRIKEFCKSNNVQLIFVIPPKRRDFTTVARTAFYKEHAIWWQKMNEVAGGTYIIGSYSCLDSAGQDSLFVEPFHLNQYGQIIFSDYVRRRLLSPDIITPGYSIF